MFEEAPAYSPWALGGEKGQGQKWAGPRPESHSPHSGMGFVLSCLRRPGELSLGLGLGRSTGDAPGPKFRAVLTHVLASASSLPWGLRFLVWIYFPKQRKDLAIVELALEVLKLK